MLVCYRAPVLGARFRRAAVCLAVRGSDDDGNHASSVNRHPWKLMGRVVRADTFIDESDVSRIERTLVRRQLLSKLQAAIPETDLDEQTLSQRLDDVVALLPGIEHRLSRLQPALVSALIRTTNNLPLRLIELKQMLPGTDIARVAVSRPSLLLDGEWELIPGAISQLTALFRDEFAADVDGAIAKVVEAQPIILVQDIPALVAEMQRLLGSRKPCRVLYSSPDIVTSIMNNQGLSLWLFSYGTSQAARALRRSPEIVLQLQSGSRGLGPAAEVDPLYQQRWNRPESF